MAALAPVIQKFVLHWGEMGTRWGVNRTVAQIHALLYVSPKPLDAEEITNTLSIARSNVSYGLRELQNWGIIKPVHLLGDRREHYESLKDVWQMFQIVLDERKRREVDPTVTVLRECVQALERQGGEADAQTRKRLQEMLDFFEGATAVYDEVRRLSLDAIRRLVKSSSRLQRLLNSAA